MYHRYNVTYDANGGTFTQNGVASATKLRKEIYQNYVFTTGRPLSSDGTYSRRTTALGTPPTVLAATVYPGNDSTVELSNLGNTFSNWYYLDDSGNEVTVTAGSTIFPTTRTKNITLYAKWTSTTGPTTYARLAATSGSTTYYTLNGTKSNNYTVTLPQNVTIGGTRLNVKAWDMRVSSSSGTVIKTYNSGENVRIGVLAQYTYFTPNNAAVSTHTIKVYGGKLYKDRNRTVALGATSSSGSGASQLNTYTVNDGQWLCAYPNSGTAGYWRMLDGSGSGTAQECSRTATYVFAAEGDIYLSYLNTVYSGEAVMALNPQIGFSKATVNSKRQTKFACMLQYELASGCDYAEMGILYTTASLWTAKGNSGSPTASALQNVDTTNTAIYKTTATGTPSMTRQIDVVVTNNGSASNTSRTFYAVGYVKYTKNGSTYYKYSNMYSYTYTTA